MAIDNSRICATCVFASLAVLNYGKRELVYYLLAGYLLLFAIGNLYIFYPLQWYICTYNFIRYTGYFIVPGILIYLPFRKK